MAGWVLPAVLAAGIAQADTRESAPGYVGDTGSNVLRSGGGDCVRTSEWSPDKATVVGCDGYALDLEFEVLKGEPSEAVIITIPSASLFAFDSAELSEEGKQAMESYRAEIAPKITDAYAAAIIGHTDSTGDDAYNMELSFKRAQSVNDYLVATGIPAERLRVLGRGENDPIAPNDTPENQARNRRVEIIVLAELRALDAMRIPSLALFPRRSAELTTEGRQRLEQNRAQARSLLEDAIYVEVVGHTDDVGDDAYNQELSEQRANTVRDYRVDTGADGSKIVAVGAGEHFPIASNNTPEGRAQNRRVEVLVLGRLR